MVQTKQHVSAPLSVNDHLAQKLRFAELSHSGTIIWIYKNMCGRVRSFKAVRKFERLWARLQGCRQSLRAVGPSCKAGDKAAKLCRKLEGCRAKP